MGIGGGIIIIIIFFYFYVMLALTNESGKYSYKKQQFKTEKNGENKANSNDESLTFAVNTA